MIRARIWVNHIERRHGIDGDLAEVRLQLPISEAHWAELADLNGIGTVQAPTLAEFVKLAIRSELLDPLDVIPPAKLSWCDRMTLRFIRLCEVIQPWTL